MRNNQIAQKKDLLFLENQERESKPYFLNYPASLG